MTASLRSRSNDREWNPDQLFLAVKKPHRAVASSTIARWLKSILLSAGVDTSLFSAHSIRGASSSKAAMSGATVKNILDTADWTSAGTFRRFYLRLPIGKQLIDQEVQSHPDYTTAVLSSSKSRCDTEPEPSDVQSQNG